MSILLITILGILLMQDVNAENKQDYSAVDSQQKAIELAKENKLFKILLFPAEFGGEDIPPNVVYVPAGIPEIKDKITGTIIRFYQDGLIDNLQVKPEYKGKSFVPSKIIMHTSKEGETGEFNPTIEIW